MSEISVSEYLVLKYPGKLGVAIVTAVRRGKPIGRNLLSLVTPRPVV